MPLNVVSNYAANVAHRNLAMTDAQASSSLAKLSIGKRVVSARDDAASMAIGSRMNAEVQGLKQAVVNAGQANSMLQIADGAMSTVSDILTRMKTLAIQSSSGNLSSTEREFLNVEFQALMNEVDRVADDTDFNGTKLLDGSIDFTRATGFGTDAGVAAINAQGVSAGDYTMSYDSDTTAETYTFSLTTDDGAYTGVIDTAAIDYDTSGNAVLTRATTLTLEGSSVPGSITISLNTAFDANTDIATASGASVANGIAGTTELSLSFKLGTGSESEDSLSFTLDAINAASLGVSGRTIVDASQAASAVEAVNNAVDTLNEFRADVGAAQNRLDFAAGNLKVSIENAEAARSTLLDLDIAQEMTTFTSKQVLMQSGVAMLAQANQMPQNLLRLLQ